MRHPLASLPLLLAAFSASPSLAAWAPGGIPLCTAAGSQYANGAVSDVAGGAIVVFSDGHVFAQRVTAGGTIAAGYAVNGNPVSHSPGNAISPRAGPDGAGGAFVVWEDNRTDVADLYGQHILASGALDPAWPSTDLPIAVGPFNQYDFSVAADGAGGFFVTWQDDRSAVDLDVYVQRVSAAGVPLWTTNGLPVCVAAGNQFLPHVVADGLGGAYLVWVDERSNPRLAYAQHLAADGSVAPGWPAGSLALGNPGPIGAENDAVVTADGSGGVLVAWTGTNNKAVFHPFVLRLTATGAIAPGWPAAGVQMCNLLQTQDIPLIVPDRTGGAIVVWRDFRDISNPLVTYHLYAQRVNGSGMQQWTANGLPVCTAAGGQQNATAVSDDQGGVIVSWDDSRGPSNDIYALRLLANGTRPPGWDADGNALCSASGAQVGPFIVPDGFSGAIVAWSDSRSTVRFQNPDIYATKTLDDIVVPVVVSLVSATAEAGRVRIAWRVPSAGVAASVWRRIADGLWAQGEPLVSAGDGSLAYEDRSVEPGTAYDYRLGLGADGGEPFAGEARVLVPGGPAFALAGAEPNPAADGLALAFSLPDDAPASLEVLDIAGRVLATRRVGALGAGRHMVRVAEAGALAPGLYYIRLTRAGRALTARAAVVR